MKWEHAPLGTQGESSTRPGETSKQDMLNKIGISGKFLHGHIMPISDPPSKSVQDGFQGTLGTLPTRQWDLAHSMTCLTHNYWGTTMHQPQCQTWEKETQTLKQAVAVSCVE